jgi:hypothetical protein
MPELFTIWVAAARAMSPPRRSVWELVKEEIDGGNLAVPDDYEIGSGVSWRLARAARHPPDPTAIAYLLRRGERLILEVRMSSLDHACDAVDLVTAAVSAVRFVEHSVFLEDLIDRCASTRGVDLTEHVVEIAKQQGRCSLGHGFSPVIVKFGLHSLEAGWFCCGKAP